MPTNSKERILSEAVLAHTLLWLANALRHLPSVPTSLHQRKPRAPGKLNEHTSEVLPRAWLAYRGQNF